MRLVFYLFGPTPAQPACDGVARAAVDVLAGRAAFLLVPACPKDVRGLPLIVSHQQLEGNVLTSWLGAAPEELNIVATFNLIRTPALMVEAGLGYAFAFAGLVPMDDASPLRFRPLSPRVATTLALMWKRGLPLTRATRLFLDQVRLEIDRA